MRNKFFKLLLIVGLTSSALFAQCDKSLLEKIKTTIGEKRKMVDALTVCKKWLYKDELSIFVMTFPVAGTSEENLEDGLAEYDVHTVVYDTKQKAIQNHLYQEALYSSDAVRLEKIRIDTARYNLNKDTRAFGITAIYRGASRANPYNIDSLDLYISDEKSLRKVLEVVISEDGGEWDTNCAGDFYDSKSIVLITKHKTNGFYDLSLKRTSLSSHTYLKNNECEETQKPKTYQTLPFKYDGKVYKVYKSKKQKEALK